MSLEEAISKNTVVIETQNRLLKAILAKLAGGTAVEPLLAEDQVSTPKPKRGRPKKEEKPAPVVQDQDAPKAILTQGPVGPDDITTAPAEPEPEAPKPAAPAPEKKPEELNAYCRWFAAPKGEVTLDVMREGLNLFFQTMNDRTGDSSAGVQAAKKELEAFNASKVSELSEANRLVFLIRLNDIAAQSKPTAN